MTIEQVKAAKEKAEGELMKILMDLRTETGCRIAGVSITTEEAFGMIAEIMTAVEIRLEIQ